MQTYLHPATSYSGSLVETVDGTLWRISATRSTALSATKYVTVAKDSIVSEFPIVTEEGSAQVVLMPSQVRTHTLHLVPLDSSGRLLIRNLFLELEALNY